MTGGCPGRWHYQRRLHTIEGRPVKTAPDGPPAHYTHHAQPLSRQNVEVLLEY